MCEFDNIDLVAHSRGGVYLTSIAMETLRQQGKKRGVYFKGKASITQHAPLLSAP